MKLAVGDFLDTTEGLLSVQCPIKFNPNNHEKYKVVGGKTLYWLQDMNGLDIFKWDHELEKIMTEAEKLAQTFTEDDTHG